ncbi:enoyl-ACP reductase FabV [Alkalimarinus coralli]|uniref:enoyl-ACP reductase FabV n=1 Tax=Alkalimarinus coralli TaxID=2935863 RepID=UPI00202B5F13|nr:enoyl-ACP reductase FabV [Alkalimarinus coralli]
MVIKPKVKGFICVNAHPNGCFEYVNEQAEFATAHTLDGPKRALIIGSSSGYGLASRIALALGGAADTIGVHFDREPTERKTATAGWYNNMRVEQLARARGLVAESLNMDAFQEDAKLATIKKIRETVKKVDLVVYSVAAPRRYVASEDKWYSSVLKPIGSVFKGKTIDTDKGEIKSVELMGANQEEIDATIKVMGGEDWQHWIEALNNAGVLADGCKTIAYTYIGDEITWPIYGDATIGQAKKDLDKTVTKINTLLQNHGGSAHIGVLKALVTQSSAAIPVMPLYISLLYQVMKEKGTHEGCIEQIYRILTTGLYGDNCQKDSAGRLRVDEHELTEEVQSEVKRRWELISNENLRQLSDFDGYRRDFLKLFGFGFQRIDYEASVETVLSE